MFKSETSTDEYEYGKRDVNMKDDYVTLTRARYNELLLMESAYNVTKQKSFDFVYQDKK